MAVKPWIVVGLLVWGVWVGTLEPTISTGDSGELTAAAYHLGVAHPPGYPMFTVLNHMGQWMPLGNIAFRSNVMSAWCMWVTIMLLGGLMSRWATGGSPHGGTSGSDPSQREPTGTRDGCGASRLGWKGASWVIWGVWLAFALSDRAWAHAVETEVYALHALLAAGVIVTLEGADRQPARWYLAAGILGAAMMHHPVSWAWAPLVVLWSWGTRKWQNQNWLLWGAMVGLGWMWVGVLPIRSLAFPGMDWGHPAEWTALLRQVFRGQYGSIEGAPRTWASVAGQFKWFASWMNAQWPWWSWGVAAWGWWVMRKLSPYAAWGSLVALVVLAGGLILALNPTGSPTSSYLIREFFVGTSMMGGMWLCVALAALWQKSWQGRGIALAVSLALLGMNFVASAGKAQGGVAYWYGRNILGVVEPDSVVFAAGDKGVIPLAYLAMVEGWRPDVVMFDDIGCVFPNVYGDDFLGLDGEHQEGRRTEVQQDLLKYFEKVPVYTMEGSYVFRSGTRFTSLGLVSKLNRAEREERPALREALRRGWFDPRWERTEDYIAKDMVAESWYLRAEEAEARGRVDEAKRAYRTAERVAQDVQWVKTKISRVMGERGKNPEEAVRLAEEAVQLDPRAPQGHNSLGLAYMDAHRLDDAILAFGEALRMDLHFTEAYNNLANAYLGKGRIEEAKAAYERTLQLDPRHVRAHNNLGILHFRQGHIEPAISEFEQAVQLDANYINAHTNLGAAYYKVGRVTEAIREWEWVLRRDPQHAEAKSNLEAVKGHKGP